MRCGLHTTRRGRDCGAGRDHPLCGLRAVQGCPAVQNQGPKTGGTGEQDLQTNALQRWPHPNSQSLGGYYPRAQEGKVANGIGTANSERRKQEGEPGPSQWGLKCVLGGAWSNWGDASFEDGGGATGQGMQMPLEAGEGKERDSSLGPPERNLTFWTPDPSPVKPVSDFSIKRECSTKPLNFGNFFFFNIRRGI